MAAEILALIKENGALKRIPTVVLTASKRRKADIAKLLNQLHAETAVLTKPHAFG